MGHKATVKHLHLSRSWAADCAVPHVSPISSSSLLTVLRHVVVGLPGFRFPDGDQRNACLGIRSAGILRT